MIKTIMKRYFNKITMGIALMAMGVMASCSDSVPSEDFGPSPEVNSDGVFFHTANSAYMAKAKNDTLKIALGRSKADAAQTYQLVTNVTDSAGVDAKNNIIVENAVSFKAGESTDSVMIIMKDIEYDNPYTVTLSVADKDATPYADCTESFTITCEDPDAWELLSDKAIFVNNLWSSILSGSTTAYQGVVIKKYKGKDIFRIYDLPATFRAEWTQDFQLAPDCELTVDPDTYPIEIDCEKYSDPKARIKKLYMPFQSLGIKLNQLEGTAYKAKEVWAGSVAHNLMSATTGEPITEAVYPLGTYDPVNGIFKFGNLAVDYGDDDLGIRLCQSETALYLDESKMETDVRDLLYKNVRRAVFNSKAYLNEDGSYMSQGTKLGVCVDEEYEDASTTFRISSPYNSGYDLFFTHKNGRVKFLDAQYTGSTALGGFPIMCEASSSSYVKTDDKEKYVFNLVFYYTNDKGVRYDLGEFEEELVLGSTITYFTADDLIPEIPLNDYIGTWRGEFTYVSDQNYTAEFDVTIEKEDKQTLVIRGLSPYMETNYGYDSSLYLEYNKKTGVFDFYPQYANTYNQYQINVYTANLDDPNSELYDGYNLRVGFVKDGRIAFVNNPENRDDRGEPVEVNCAVFYTPASGGALVEPFIPYNLVLTKVEDNTEPSNVFGSAIRNMIPWRSFGAIRSRNTHSNGKATFETTKNASVKMQKVSPSKFTR